jgi:hypothetical protein
MAACAVVKLSEQDVIEWASVHSNAEINRRIDELINVVLSAEYDVALEAKFESSVLVNVLRKRGALQK